MPVTYDVLIIGAGIVGLATALKIKEKKPALSVVVLDKEDAIAQHQTGNNSGVIHSGLYYKPGSQKAINCITGYKMLVEFCDTHKIDYELCGKVVVAIDEAELPELEKLYKRGLEHGLKGLKMLDKVGIKEYEPHINGIKGFHVPQTGIVNYTLVAEKMAEVFKGLGGEIILNSKVTKVDKTNTSVTVHAGSTTYKASYIVNCAGLYSDKVARLNGDNEPIKIVPFRGEYFKLSKEKEYLIKNLVYPVPDPNFPFLGVHFTRMKKGGVEAGPNAVLAYKREGYKKSQINLGEFFETLAWPGFRKVAVKYWKTGLGEFYRSYSKKAFTKALQRLLPEITEKDLVPGGAGVRAQACDKEGGLLDDFAIHESDRTVNVYNAPSPAATSSLAIGTTIAEITLKHF
ncbi:MAG: L-2-hydroxyglutarate oxidase [Cyclobacteriaceae bacterium]|nr:L-2-hydroxyglutarate oxidase [Cyclobacteriaceae bacterium]